ncbi:undecaprenyldiphospho-muramoylpentapeptide beta-N-acetylglucosaminyltransferase [Lagierella sp.]|uniref:undecaprenyldiphospho-muramoylpentapeptide beta-N-acetylglucosaminyltransferase n=1 Tax=Lagierella sp. TaxID=2849657 RepID=UPI002605DD26|nr:undecaprenyldiphospho-muramoylpentapeptide beta-N-acetylglucosaminyltransferase [Lagierella sp.]
MKIVVTGGGTGGHIYPAIAIIEEFQKQYPDTKVLYIGRKGSLESILVPNSGYEFYGITAAPLSRKIGIKTLKTLKDTLKGVRESKKIIREFNPNFVIGTGGFVTGPVLLAAHLAGKKVFFHEQNSYPGVTNKILSRFAKKYFVTFKESIKYFKNQERAIVTGNPIRNKFVDIDSIKSKAKFHMGFNNDNKNVLAFGGSNGSGKLNNAFKEIINGNLIANEFNLFFVTGKNNYDDFVKDMKVLPNVKVYPYLDNIQEAYSISDLVITSSGAITLAELSYLGMPSILIPKAYTTENHQVYNALEFKNSGASIMIEEKDLRASELKDIIVNLLKDEDRLKDMGIKAKTFATPNASKDIIKNIVEEGL